MTILQLIQRPQLRGAEMFASQLSNELVQMGHSVLVVALFPGESTLPINATFILLNRPQHKRWNDVEGWKALAKLIKEHNVDVVQCNAGDTLKFAVFSQLFTGWKIPIIARNASMVSAYIKNPIIKLLNRWFYSKTQAIVSVSHLAAKDLNTLFPETTSKTTVIPIGINLQSFTPVAWKNASPTAFQMVHVGGFSFEKNHYGLLSIFEQWLHRFPDSHLHLIGDGPMREEIEQAVAKKKLTDKISFYGFSKEAINYMHQADVVVLPSSIEGLPGVILEAMYAKTPVIAYNVGGVSEVVQNNKTGFLIEKGDEKGFLQAIEQVKKEGKVARYILNANELVVQKFNNSYLAQQFEKIYYKIS
ncbi:glycosyltransferase family 4 protein [Flavobacterium orientale]|uniref:Glycosyl transferase n=1 Tax=Flavobacterium orientale TaxID=1756020 RepID=A0A916Y456_9FLAO|nr:glycosyltransferase family 4 protein [Flavobacterium orientale]GGD30252.1 glycosyl transferase [Flavobacterium orientale]